MVTPYMKNEDIAAEFRRDWNSNLFDRIVGIMNDAKYLQVYFLQAYGRKQEFLKCLNDRGFPSRLRCLLFYGGRVWQRCVGQPYA